MEKQAKRAVDIVSANVRYWRHERGYTQEELAYSAAMDRSYLARLEAGGCNISIKKLFSLADALELEPEELLQNGVPEEAN